MKISKTFPQASVAVFRGKRKDEFHMIALRPQEIAVLTYDQGKWITPAGTVHRTHRDAMRQILFANGDKELMNAVMKPEVKREKAGATKAEHMDGGIQFENKRDLLEYVLKQGDIVDMLLEKLNTYQQKSQPTKKSNLSRS